MTGGLGDLERLGPTTEAAGWLKRRR